MNYTKGEWKASSNRNTIVHHVFSGDKKVAECYYGCQPSCEEAESNAQLIAAAPDMYEALKEAYKELTYHNWNNTTTGFQILAAINKAEGKTI